MTPSGRLMAGVAVLVVSMAGPHAMATTLNWTFQQIIGNPSNPTTDVACAMRTGATWPTVFSPHDGGLQAFSLTPAGWSQFALGSGSGVRARPGQDGRVGVAWWGSNEEIKFAQSSNLGWQSSTVPAVPGMSLVGGPDVDYLSGNRPVVAYCCSGGSNDTVAVAAHDGLSWNTDTVGLGNEPTLAVDSQDRVGVAFRNGNTVLFALNDVSSGTWIEMPVGSFSPTHMSLDFGPNDETGIAVLDDGSDTLSYAYFNTQSGQWAVDLLSTSVSSQRVNLTFNSQGHPALAYVDSSLTVHYRINDGEGWADIILPTGVDPDTSLDVDPTFGVDAAVAFDGNDIPLIAYYADSGLLLAYDPVPEPATGLLVLIGLVGVIRRGQQG